ncbi:Hypothetical predicted protein, partial [Scomber scombrus]
MGKSGKTESGRRIRVQAERSEPRDTTEKTDELLNLHPTSAQLHRYRDISIQNHSW